MAIPQRKPAIGDNSSINGFSANNNNNNNLFKFKEQITGQTGNVVLKLLK